MKLEFTLLMYLILSKLGHHWILLLAAEQLVYIWCSV